MFQVKISLGWDEWAKVVGGFLLFFIVSSCNTVHVPPTPQYDRVNLTQETSVLTLPVRVSRTELVKLLNEQIGQLLYEDVSPQSDLKMRVHKGGNFELWFTEHTIFYELPLKLWVRQELMFGGGVEAEGSLRLKFATQWDIDSSWQLQTQTLLEGFDWIEQPRIRLAGFSLSVTALANLVLDQYSGQIGAQIDSLISEQLDLRQMVEEAWLSLFAPSLLSEEYNTWLLINPQSIGLTRPRVTPDSFAFEIVVEGMPSVLVDAVPPLVRPAPLPPLQWLYGVGENFALYIETKVSFDEAERMANESMRGYVYSMGRGRAVVEEITLYGQGPRLVVRTRLSGLYNGDVYLLGKPKYNAPRNRIELEDITFDFSRHRGLMRLLSWLFKGYLHRQVEENLNFYLGYNLEEIKQTIEESLSYYEIAPGVTLQGQLEDLGVQHTWIAPDGIRVQVVLKGKLLIGVGGTIMSAQNMAE